MTRMASTRLSVLAVLALGLGGCGALGTLNLYGFDEDDDDATGADDDDASGGDDDDATGDDDDASGDDDDAAGDDDDATPPETCDDGPLGAFSDALALATAMDVAKDELVGVIGADHAEMMAVRTGMGGICPVVGTRMALLSTGLVTNIQTLQDHDYPGDGPDGAAGDKASLTLTLQAPPSANWLRVHVLFLTREYPEWVGSAYSDGASVHVEGEAYTGEVLLDSVGDPISVNSPYLVIVSPDAILAGTGFDEDGATGWLRVDVPVSGGDLVSVSFSVYDVADGIFDSAMLVDGLEFRADGGDGIFQVWP